MKRTILIKHLKENNCILKREGSKHSIYINQNTGIKTQIPRHTDINEITASQICKQLGIPKPKIN
jgi:mRNA interferase HicA